MSNLHQLSYFTGTHGQHDPAWTIPGSRPTSLFCLACAVETLEEPHCEVPAVKKKYLLGELLKALNLRDKLLLDLLAGDDCVVWHLVRTVYGILDGPDETLLALVIEVLVQLCCTFKSEELVSYLVHQISVQVQQGHSWSASLPGLILLGQLLDSIPSLTETLGYQQDSMIGILLPGLSYPDEKVKSTCAFILVHIISQPTEGSRQVSRAEIGRLAGSILPVLVTAQSTDLRINAMGLLKRLLEYEHPTETLMRYQGQTSLPSVIKKMLMSREDTLQVSGVQCIAQILLHQHTAQPSQHCRYAEELLNSDVAEFLYETLATANGLLLRSTFCCLLLFTEIDSFFSKCHTVYGIESMVRAVQQSMKLNNTEALNHGLQLLSEIFKKHPEGVYLMNNDATLTQLCTTLTDCMTHTQITTVIHASQTLANLLRGDQLPRPIPLQPLINSLEALLDSLRRLPKPLVGSNRPAQHPKHSRHRHTRQERPSRTHRQHETLLSNGLNAMHRAFRLAASCLTEPAALESQFTAPSVQTSDAQTRESQMTRLTQFLLQAAEETCIPLVVVNVDSLSVPDIFTSLFNMLSVAMEIGLSDLQQFSVKLVSSSFIQLALTIKNKFPTQDRQLQDAINSFLGQLCVSIQGPCSLEAKQRLRTTLQTGLPQIHGSASEMLHLLYELPPSSCGSSSLLLAPDDTDRSLQIKQETCLALLYYAFLYNDKIVPESEVIEATLSFLVNHPDLKSLATSTSKHLLFLLAMCSTVCNQPLPAAVQSFIKVLQERDLCSVYTHHPALITWCVESPSIPAPFTCRTMEQWLMHRTCGERPDPWEQGGQADVLPNLLRRHSRCLQVLLDILSSGNDKPVQNGLLVLENVLHDTASCADDESTTEEMLKVLRRRLPDILHGIFLSGDQTPSDVQILALLQLSCTLHEKRSQTELDPVDIKLMYHVSNLISQFSTSSSPDILQACLNYLTCLLINTSMQDQSTVASVLLSNVPTLKLLESLLSSKSPSHLQPHQCSCLTILTQTITSQAKSRLKVSYTMGLDLSFAMDVLRQNKHTLRKVCGLQLWTILFDTKFESPVLRVSKSSAHRSLLDDEDAGLNIQARHLKTIYVWLQNSIVQADPVLCHAVVTCMRSLIAYLTERSQSLAHHLLGQPWNHQLVTYCLEISLDYSNIPTHVIQLLTMFLQHGNMEDTVSIHHLEQAADYLKSLDGAQSMNQQALSDALLLAQQMVVQPDVKLTPKMVQSLYAFLQQVTNPANYQSLDKPMSSILHVNSVIIQHPDWHTVGPMASLQPHQMPSFANDLLEKIATYQD